MSLGHEGRGTTHSEYAMCVRSFFCCLSDVTIVITRTRILFIVLACNRIYIVKVVGGKKISDAEQVIVLDLLSAAPWLLSESSNRREKRERK